MKPKGEGFVMQRLRIDLIAAARPNFMKVAPLFHALHEQAWCSLRLVHTGQHYDQNMSDAFFSDLKLPPPDLHLDVGSGSHAEQTAGVMLAYERACIADRPDLIVVVGDVNSTVACALVGTKLHVPVAHLEAGLRSRDRQMPEEINRLVTDVIADILWTPSPDGDENLAAEGVAAEKVTRVGNIMLDSYELMRERIEASGERHKLGLDGREYGVVTLHRPSNVDVAAPLTALVEQLTTIAAKLPLVFPVHPRTRRNLETFGLWSRTGRSARPARHRAARLRGFHECGVRRAPDHHRFGWRPGGNHLPRHTVPDGAHHDRTSDHDHRGDQSTGDRRRAGARRGRDPCRSLDARTQARTLGWPYRGARGGRHPSPPPGRTGRPRRRPTIAVHTDRRVSGNA